MINPSDELESYEITPTEQGNTNNREPAFIIPARFRKMENLHILFWLVKDISWCMVWRPLGIAMIFPTLVIAIIIMVRTRKYVSEFCHNLAVTLWIIANSYWMISEFFVFDSDPVNFRDYGYKDLTVIPFTLGILVLMYYYLWWRPRNKEAVDTMY